MNDVYSKKMKKKKEEKIQRWKKKWRKRNDDDDDARFINPYEEAPEVFCPALQEDVQHSYIARSRGLASANVAPTPIHDLDALHRRLLMTIPGTRMLPACDTATTPATNNDDPTTREETSPSEPQGSPPRDS
ncbi:hypothetical protein Tco_1493998 [Tanacetum coccineum]